MLPACSDVFAQVKIYSFVYVVQHRLLKLLTSNKLTMNNHVFMVVQYVRMNFLDNNVKKSTVNKETHSDNIEVIIILLEHYIT